MFSMNWSSAYVTRKVAARHCWDLVCAVYADELNIILPSYDGSVVSADERREVEALVQDEAAQSCWTEVPPAEAAPFDVLVFRRGGVRSHVGIAVDAKHMLHALDRVCVERWATPRWSLRLAGVFRHADAFGGTSA